MVQTKTAIGLRTWACLCVAGIAASASGIATAQTNFPLKPMRILIGFVPGGFTDIAGRMVAQGLTDALGQQVVAENRPGANGGVAAELTARAAPDGYTFYMASPGHTTNPMLQARAHYDPIKDFTPISLFADIPNVLVIHPSVPVKSLKELVTLIKSKPGYLTLATTGVGAPGHLSGELMQMKTGTKLIHVPYKGSAPVLVDLIGGQVDLSFPSTASALPYVQQGRLRAIAVTSAKRSPAYPDVPTMMEAGLPDFVVQGGYGVIGPARMPQEIVSRLGSEIAKLAKHPDIRARLQKLGAEAVGSTPEEFAAYIVNDHAKWAKVVKAANIPRQ
jgi:tripartite-type tricarboxylate transporter receptor subunit TctC